MYIWINLCAKSSRLDSAAYVSTRKYDMRFASCKETRLALARHDRPYSIQDSRITTVYRCLHGTAPEHLSELLVPASRRLVTASVSDPLQQRARCTASQTLYIWRACFYCIRPSCLEQPPWQNCGNTAPKLSKFQILAINLPPPPGATRLQYFMIFSAFVRVHR